jgi:hypothetical protein
MSDTDFDDLKALVSNLPDEYLDWGQLWELRTKVGDLMLGASPTNYPVYKTVYDKYTQMLKVRAEELGKAEEFAEADRLTQLEMESRDVLNKLQNASSGLEYSDILHDPAKQKEIAALQSFVEGELPKDYLIQGRDSHKSAYRIAASARAGERLRYRDILGFAYEWVRDKIKKSSGGKRK